MNKLVRLKLYGIHLSLRLNGNRLSLRLKRHFNILQLKFQFLSLFIEFKEFIEKPIFLSFPLAFLKWIRAPLSSKNLLVLLPLSSLLFSLNLSLASTAKIKKQKRSEKTAISIPLIEKATLEINKIQQNMQQNIQKTNQGIDSKGIFTVQAPKLKITDRKWKYLLGLKAQYLKPSGKVHSPFVGDFNLDTYDQQIFPTLEFGIGKSYEELAPWSDWSLGLQLGYNRTRVPMVFKTGYRAPDSTSLNTLNINAHLETHYLATQHLAMQHSTTINNPLFYKIGLSFGKFFHSQTSPNDLAQFSENLLFAGLNFGVLYSFSTFLHLTGDYIYRQSLQDSDLELQKNNFEMGLRILW